MRIAQLTGLIASVSCLGVAVLGSLDAAAADRCRVVLTATGGVAAGRRVVATTAGGPCRFEVTVCATPAGDGCLPASPIGIEARSRGVAVPALADAPRDCRTPVVYWVSTLFGKRPGRARLQAIVPPGVRARRRSRLMLVCLPKPAATGDDVIATTTTTFVSLPTTTTTVPPIDGCGTAEPMCCEQPPPFNDGCWQLLRHEASNGIDLADLCVAQGGTLHPGLCPATCGVGGGCCVRDGCPLHEALGAIFSGPVSHILCEDLVGGTLTPEPCIPGDVSSPTTTLPPAPTGPWSCCTGSTLMAAIYGGCAIEGVAVDGSLVQSLCETSGGTFTAGRCAEECGSPAVCCAGGETIFGVFGDAPGFASACASFGDGHVVPGRCPTTD